MVDRRKAYNQEMMRRTLLSLLVATASVGAATFPDPLKDMHPAGRSDSVVFAAGCFWGVEAVFERVKGVTEATSGYAGGSRLTAHYEIVSTGATGHAESVKVVYDPSQITFGQLLKVYFAVAHDPTELNRQGPDEGTQYRSSIFYTSEEQKQVALAYIRQLDEARVFRSPIVTKVVPLDGFYPAEAYHQRFFDRNPDYPYIVFNDLPKVKHLEAEFPALLKR
jgi:peptide-methionine (S)-S-oxide reductase